MNPVLQDSSEKIKEYASGVCSIGYNDSATRCCTGFRIADDLIMTNFHCLACVHSIFRTLVGNTPRLMEPSRFLYAFSGNRPEMHERVKSRMRAEGYEIDYEKFFIPANDAEFKTLLNTYPQFFSGINFEMTLDNDRSLPDSRLKIQEILAMNLEHDYSVLRVEGMSSSQKIFKLSDQAINKGQKLTIIGHPSVGPFPHMKVYDDSRKCRVVNPVNTEWSTRVNVFTHQCDTAPGSSGSPIIDRESGMVVGIHWGGSVKSRKIEKKEAYGIEMKSILNELEVIKK